MAYTAESLVREIARMDPEAPDYEETLRTLIGEARRVPLTEVAAELDALVAAARAEGLRESDGDSLEAIVRRAYGLGSKHAHESEDGP